MARVKRGTTTRARHKSVYSKTKGFRHGRKNLIKVAKQAAVKAAKNAYIGRKQKKRNFRSLWIIRINAACRQNGITYSQFINKLQEKKIEINRKEISEMVLKDEKAFKNLLAKATK
jgi:large subunit ribosomal protein L20